MKRARVWREAVARSKLLQPQRFDSERAAQANSRESQVRTLRMFLSSPEQRFQLSEITTKVKRKSKERQRKCLYKSVVFLVVA